MARSRRDRRGRSPRGAGVSPHRGRNGAKPNLRTGPTARTIAPHQPNQVSQRTAALEYSYRASSIPAAEFCIIVGRAAPARSELDRRNGWPRTGRAGIARLHLGPRQHTKDAPPSQRRAALLAWSLARHARASATGGQQHAARADARLRRVNADGCLPRSRARGHLSSAWWRKWKPAFTVLPRRSRRLGSGEGNAVFTGGKKAPVGVAPVQILMTVVPNQSLEPTAGRRDAHM